MWILAVCLFMLAQVAVEAGPASEQCMCSQLHHPQEKFCSSDFAFRVEILNGSDSPGPGEEDNGEYYQSYFVYAVRIVEVFKTNLTLVDVRAGDLLDIYNPQKGMCGKTNLYDREARSNDYLLTGYIGESSNGIIYAGITSCNWVRKWINVTDVQLEGMRGSYEWCNCTVYPVSGEMHRNKPARDRFDLETCLYNPVAAHQLKVADCETSSGVCVWDGEASKCTWRYDGQFKRCYDSRLNTLSNEGKAAIASMKDCSLYTGKKRRLCKIKFLKAIKNSA